MALIFEIALTVTAVVICMLVLVLFTEVVAAMIATASAGGMRPERGDVAVIVPAHNEGDALLRTLADVQKQLRPQDRLLVIADNCTDNTAAVAMAAGAEVAERHEQARVGKGYALAHGIAHVSAAPPAFVVFVDADCLVKEGAIDHLVAACAATGRPSQALNLMLAPRDAGPGLKVAEFAWRVKNWARPLGLSVLGLPCQLMGTGMAFPWGVISAVSLASGDLVEDLKLGLDLAEIDAAPRFCPSAIVTSEFPAGAAAAARQRLRWEHGHATLIATRVPALILAGVRSGNIALLALSLDLAVPPLSLLAMLVFSCFAITFLGAIVGFSSFPMMVSIVAFIGLVVAVALAWIRWGKIVLPGRDFLRVPGYVVGKLPLYGKIFSGSAPGEWVRTDRKGPFT